MCSGQQQCNIFDVDVNHKRLKRKKSHSNNDYYIIITFIITFTRAVMKVTTHKMFNLYYKTHLCIIIILSFVDIRGMISFLLLYIYILCIHTQEEIGTH